MNRMAIMIMTSSEWNPRYNVQYENRGLVAHAKSTAPRMADAPEDHISPPTQYNPQQKATQSFMPRIDGMDLPNPKPLLNRLLLPIPINILPIRRRTRISCSNRRLLICRRLRLLLRLNILLIGFLHSMRNAVLPPLLSILDAAVALLADAHGLVLHVHAVYVQSLGDGVEGGAEQAGPGWEEVGEGGGCFEVCGEGECCQGC